MFFIKLYKYSNISRVKKLYLNLLHTKKILKLLCSGLSKFQLSVIFKSLSCGKFTLIASRVDFLLFESGLVVGSNQLNQALLHSHILVNNCINLTAYTILKPKDLILVTPTYFITYRLTLICSFFKTFLFIRFLKRYKHVSKKISTSCFLGNLKFPSFIEINFRIAGFEVVANPTLQGVFASGLVSVYNLNQLKFVL